MADPALLDRLNMLEAKVANLNLRDLPMSAIMRKLEADWQPDASTLLQGGSIGIDALSAALMFGVNTVTWGGASRFSAVLTVLHGLGRTPTVVQLGSNGLNTHLAYFNLTPTTFDVGGNTIDGAVPAAATTSTFGWLAL